MHPDKFLGLYILRGDRTIEKKIQGWGYREYMKLAGLTKYLKFGCNFIDGVCKKYRTPMFDNSSMFGPKMCCCISCRNNFGFHHVLPNNYTIISAYAKMFDNATGFWRSKGGCILPRSHRSPVCLTYNCDYNTCRPDSHKHLIKCLNGDKGCKAFKGRTFRYEPYAVEAMADWLEAPPTYEMVEGIIGLRDSK